jgi:hypothetical protein
VSSGGVYSVSEPFRRAQIKNDLTDVARHWLPGDVLYVHYSSQYAFGYYSECECFRLPGDRTLVSMWPVHRIAVRRPSAQFPHAFSPDSSSVIVGTRRPVFTPGPLPFYAHDASLIARHRRAWILVTFTVGMRELNLIRRELLGSLDRRGRLVTARQRGGTHLYLYAFP